MGTLVVTYAFPSDAQSFTATTGAYTVGSWESADGTPSNGCLQFRISGRNKTNANNVYSRTLTFEDMGVPAGSTITGITSGSAYYRCREWLSGSSSGNFIDYVTLTPSGQSAVTIAGPSSLYSNVSSWAQSTGTDSTGLSLASSTSCVLAWQADLSTTNNASAAVALACDLITFTLTYTTAATANPTTALGTGSAGTTSAAIGAYASVSGVSRPTAVGVVTYGGDSAVNATGDAGDVEATGAAGTISVTGLSSVSLSGVEGTAETSSLLVQDAGGGSIPIFSLNLADYAGSDTAYKYSSDTFTPTLTEDSVDSITVGMYDNFIPRLEGFGVVQLSSGASAEVSSVYASGSSGSLTVNYGTSANVTRASAVGEASNFVRPTTQVFTTITGSSGTGRVGFASANAGGATSSELNDLEATGSAGTISVYYGAGITLSGVAGTGTAGDLSQSVPVSVSLTGAAGTGAASAISPSADGQASVTGIYGTTGVGSVLVNPGNEGSLIRRTSPGRRVRTVAVHRG